jgi:hypothetical protein
MEVQLRVRAPLVEGVNAFSAGRGDVPVADVLADNRTIFGSTNSLSFLRRRWNFVCPLYCCARKEISNPTREYPAGTPQSNPDVAAGPQKLPDLLDPERLRSLHDQLLRPQFA